MKKLNFKALFINHVEKIVFGFFCLIVLMILAKTNWERYTKTPDALKQDIKHVRDKISSEANVWPVTEQQAYKIVDFTDKARQLFAPMAPIALARYSFTPPLFHPLYRKDEPRREPTFEPVQYLVAHSGLAALSMAIMENMLPIEEPAKAEMAEMKPAADDSGEFATRNPAGGAPAAAPGAPAVAKAGGAPRQPGSSAGGGAPGSSARPFGPMPGGMSSGGVADAAADPTVKARGVRFIAVRGVFPLAKQIDQFKNAMKVSQTEAQSKLEILDFVLERQTAVAGPNPWDENLTKWETVHIESALEILSECSDTDPNDPVPIALRDAVITMSLPLRLIGFWSYFATHPKIKDLELKADAIEQQNKMLESLDETLMESKTPEAQKPKGKRGLATVQRDVKSMVTAVKSSSSSMDMYRNSMSMINSSMPSSAAGRPMVNPGMSSAPGGMRGAQDLDRLVAASKYILFRYFDFDVESGMAYRYRVRLKLRNPNFELTPEELAGADPEIANGEERETPWSNISNPSVVDNTFNYYLKDIDREPYREEKVKPVEGKHVAQLEVFDWDTGFGTVVKDFLNLTSIGAFIGGVGGGLKKETTVLDLVKGSIEKKKDRKFTSLDVLVDVEPEFDISVDQHPDLKMTPNSDRKGYARLGFYEEALVATHTGDLRILNPLEDKAGEDKWISRFEKERADFKEGSTAPKKKSGLDAFTGETTEETKSKKGKKKTRTLITSPSSQSSSSPSMSR